MSGFFRTKALLEGGGSVYETANGKIVYRPEKLRASIEAYQRAQVGRRDLGFCESTGSFRPMWTFPKGTSVVLVTGFVNESDHEPIDPSAIGSSEPAFTGHYLS